MSRVVDNGLFFSTLTLKLQIKNEYFIFALLRLLTCGSYRIAAQGKKVPNIINLYFFMLQFNCYSQNIFHCYS